MFKDLLGLVLTAIGYGLVGFLAHKYIFKRRAH